MPIIGIDLGTTNSVVTYFSEDGPKVIPNSLGEELTPSVVSVGDDGEIYRITPTEEISIGYIEDNGDVYIKDKNVGYVNEKADIIFDANALKVLS